MLRCAGFRSALTGNAFLISTRFRSVCDAFSALGPSRSGNVAIVFAVSVVPLFAGIGASVDYARLTQARSKLQTIADGAALAGAQSLRLANTSSTTVSQIILNHVASQSFQAPAISTSSNVIGTGTVSVQLDQDIPTTVLKLLGTNSSHLIARAQAKVTGSTTPICVIGLESDANFTVGLDKDARLQGPGCAVYSNSLKSNGLEVKNNAVLTAALICSAGGKVGGPGAFQPTPQTGCPTMADPLAARPAPTIGSCTNNNLVVQSMTTLYPGTYCGGLTITNAASVTFASGIYVIKDGELKIPGGAVASGINTGFFFTGNNAILNFDTQSTVSFTAPNSGTMAGILFFEDRASPGNQNHQILSDNARTLLGTIYLPQGQLNVGANSPVADQSAYTIIVVRRFALSAGPTMVLNTNFSATDIPVPAGVGNNNTSTLLVQ